MTVIKKVLIFTGTGPSLGSASNKRMLAIARGLSENDVRVIWLSPLNEVPAEISHDPLYGKISFVCLSFGSKMGHKGRVASYLIKLISLIKLSRYTKGMDKDGSRTACFTVGGDLLLLTLCARIMHARGIQVFHERTEYPWLGVGKSLVKKHVIWLYYRCFISKVDQIFVISEALKEHFLGYYKNRKLKVQVDILKMMVETDRIIDRTKDDSLAQAVESSHRDITYLGTMYGDKDGLDYLIKAFLNISNDYSDARLVLVGDISRRDRLHKIRELVDIDNPPLQIIFAGKTDQEGVFRYLRNAYCLVLSRPDNIQARYGFPTKLGEYLASGKPVVVTKVGDIPLYLSDGINAYLAEPDSVDSFTNKLRECLSNPKTAAAVGSRGRETANAEFNHKKCVKVIIDAI